jgi:DNA-binding MarR family transcriptional regulator
MAREDDAVDAIKQQWLALRPDLDVSAMELAARLLRAAALIERETGAYLGGLALSRGEFDVLTALRRADAPQTPGSLRTVTLVSAAAITKRIAALQKAGLAARSPNPADGRGALISLTPAGVRLIDEAFPQVLAIERRLLAGLSPAQYARAVTSLRQILASAERPGPPDQDAFGGLPGGGAAGGGAAGASAIAG